MSRWSAEGHVTAESKAVAVDFARELAQWEQWRELIALGATAIFAVTGVLAITGEKSTDLLGAITFGVITGIGGGTIRDVIIDDPPFWGKDQWPVLVAAVAAVVAFYVRRRVRGIRIERALTYLDGLGAAMFAVQATGVVWLRDFARPSGPIILGVMTGIGGGLLRDTLAGRRTLLMRPELYATPILLGCVASTMVLWLAPEKWSEASILCIAGTFAFRAAAIRWNWSYPTWARAGAETGQAEPKSGEGHANRNGGDTPRGPPGHRGVRSSPEQPAHQQ